MKTVEKRKICIATGTRADWGLLSPVARRLASRCDAQVSIIATNMHLSERYGSTWKEICHDGFEIARRVEMQSDGDTPQDTVRSMSRCMAGMAEAFADLRPDLLLILGDRYEMLATVSAALLMRIPVAHIAGGAVSRGAYDESIRHSITKMSHIHMTETEDYRRRVIQMGENPAHVHNTGAIGVYNIMHADFVGRGQLERELGTSLPSRLLLATFHPATLDSVPAERQCLNLLAALDRHPDYKVIFTYPNNDTDGRVIIRLIEQYAAAHADRVAVYPSLGMRRYLSVLHIATAVVGNSSSGIVEVPSMHIPTLDIGLRQDGRTAARSVLHCGVEEADIANGLDTILSDEFRQMAAHVENPYYKADTLERMEHAIMDTPLDNIIVKPFHDIAQK